jgi:hypothetical protein
METWFQSPVQMNIDFAACACSSMLILNLSRAVPL